MHRLFRKREKPICDRVQHVEVIYYLCWASHMHVWYNMYSTFFSSWMIHFSADSFFGLHFLSFLFPPIFSIFSCSCLMRTKKVKKEVALGQIYPREEGFFIMYIWTACIFFQKTLCVEREEIRETEQVMCTYRLDISLSFFSVDTLDRIERKKTC